MNKKQVKKQGVFLFERRNYIVMLIGLAVIATGFILMAGGSSDDPDYFNEAMYNFRRIRLAPALVLIGFGIEFYAILLKPKK
jgi:multisubunit Na+/H+ antiporter MnhC subunit